MASDTALRREPGKGPPGSGPPGREEEEEERMSLWPEDSYLSFGGLVEPSGSELQPCGRTRHPWSLLGLAQSRVLEPFSSAHPKDDSKWDRAGSHRPALGDKAGWTAPWKVLLCGCCFHPYPLARMGLCCGSWSLQTG